MFCSNLGRMKVYDESNTHELTQTVIQNSGLGGYVERDFEASPFGSICPAFEGDLIPRSEWADRIEEMERTESSLEHLLEHVDVPILTQKRLPYCWCYGVTGAKMASYAVAGEEVPHLSATSLAAKIKNYRAEGGWAGEAIQGDLKYGTSTIEYWPEAVADRRYDTAEQRENAKLHTISEYEELPSQSFDAVMTSLFRRKPTTLGLLWWGHLVYATRPVVLGRNAFGLVIRNSWDYSWGDKGRAVLEESKATPHESFAVRTAKRLSQRGNR